MGVTRTLLISFAMFSLIEASFSDDGRSEWAIFSGEL